ncbi:MAG: hypothetical protein KGJ86_03105, partial [Chloroflexota bacterium]|nr:hypothetical protein [Chloroflexota bacterium]
ERLAEAVNNLAGGQVALAHHGSIARERRFEIEQNLKQGRLPLLIATSSLELGIDIGSVDFVIQLGSPKSVNRALQRIGRAGHSVGAVSRGRIIARFPSDLLDAAACAQGVRLRQIEATHIPRHCLDVLAQHIVAMAGSRSWRVEEMLRVARRSEPFRTLSRPQLENVLAMLDGRYADVRFSDLKPRIVWDQDADELRSRPGALRTALLNGGTIPDRGYFTVELAGSEAGERGKKLGELDEEFASELYVGGRPFFALGTSVWGVEAVDRDRVLVSPAPGQMFKIPFWRGERLDRPMEYPAGRLARELGARLRLDRDEALRWLGRECGLGPTAAGALADYVHDQQEATGVTPSDRAIVVESFADEIGDGRLVIHSLFGGRVNGAWAFALRPRLREALGGIDPLVLYNDDGIILRLPPMDCPPPLEILDQVRADTVEELLIGELADAPMLALRFREAAQRALLLPKLLPGRRTPLWLRRQRAADLLSIVRRKAGFPVLQEAVRECLHDSWDLNGLRTVLRGIEAGEISVTFRRNASPSPFAASLVWEFGVAFQEQGDAPRGECRAAYLALNRDLLRETLETENLRQLIDPRALTNVEATLERQAREVEHRAEVERLRSKAAGSGGAEREEALRLLLHRELPFFGPLGAAAIARRLRLGLTWTQRQLDVMVEASQLCRGEFRPDGGGIEYCTAEVLARLHRESLRLVREEIAPVGGERFAAFLQSWQGTICRGSASRPRQTLRSLLHLPLKRALWPAVMAARFGTEAENAADALTGRGELTWRGAGPDRLELVERSAQPRQPILSLATAPGCAEIRALLQARGALFAGDIARRLAPQGFGLQEVEQALAELEAAGEASNDLFSRAGRWSVNESAERPVPSAESRAQPTSLDSGPYSILSPQSSALLDCYAAALLDRYGVVSREMCRSERYGPRWAELERLLTTWEWRGRVLRGHFVSDLSGPQFALREAVELLREGHPEHRQDLALLAWQDPANPWGKLLPHPAPRGNGRAVLLAGGRPALLISGWGRQLQPAAAWNSSLAAPAATALCQLASWRPGHLISVERWQTGSVLVSPIAAALRDAGFRRSGLQLTYRRTPGRGQGLDIAV